MKIEESRNIKLTKTINHDLATNSLKFVNSTTRNSRNTLIHTEYADGFKTGLDVNSAASRILPELRYGGKSPATHLKRQFSTDVLRTKNVSFTTLDQS